MLRAYKLTGNPRHLNMAKHWGDVFAAKCQFANSDLCPWNRYVDPSVGGWYDVLTGTTSIIVDFLDNLMRIGYTGQAGAIVKARDAGRRLLNEQMLPVWWVNDTWARTYWDWDNPMMSGMVSMCADHANQPARGTVHPTHLVLARHPRYPIRRAKSAVPATVPPAPTPRG